jgi:hypothetical protein
MSKTLHAGTFIASLAGVLAALPWRAKARHPPLSGEGCSAAG